MAPPSGSLLELEQSGAPIRNSVLISFLFGYRVRLRHSCVVHRRNAKEDSNTSLSTVCNKKPERSVRPNSGKIAFGCGNVWNATNSLDVE